MRCVMKPQRRGPLTARAEGGPDRQRGVHLTLNTPDTRGENSSRVVTFRVTDRVNTLVY